MAAKDDKNRKSDKKKSDKPGLIERIKKFFKSLKTEFKKIVWPNRSQLVKQTIAVLLISLLLGAFIWLIDFGAKSLIGVTSQVGTGTTTAPTESAE
ncbi:MAG: preprotein translocase subunit SecE [Lachnospiraceae bacterium]|nr:preprotein translocase subunit SecE [Lachnospiraceae bacterium]MBQ7602072.1 preprotein translocase subunit SecE [Lachnospiraceae bacterium]MBR5338897.1 preprotein translocase subunit SecE [Lachnospiraceae bacterium]